MYIVRRAEIGQMSVRLWDLSGDRAMRELWRNYWDDAVLC